MISTKNRYDVLPMAIQSIAMQTRVPDEFVLFDDNESPLDLRELPTYKYLFQLLDNKGIKWQVVFGAKKGQHHNHQKSQEMAQDLVWRLDDDNIAEPNVLERLEEQIEGAGAVGGLVLEPNHYSIGRPGRIILDPHAYNVQWSKWSGAPVEAEHLYSTFLYRKGIADYNLNLSPAGHREETIFSHSIFLKGYSLLVDPSVTTWHFRGQDGGIRTYTSKEYWNHDEEIFDKWLAFTKKKKKLIILDSGIGDHIVFKSILPEIKKKYGEIIISCCYPDIFEGEEVMSIAEGQLLENKDSQNVYKFMEEHNWKMSLREAYIKLYL